jgi:uncharacterized Zn-finger protein
MAASPKLQNAPETIEVATTAPVCDGDGGPLGHPRVYLTMGADDEVECPYCDRRYVLKPGTARGGH